MYLSALEAKPHIQLNHFRKLILLHIFPWLGNLCAKKLSYYYTLNAEIVIAVLCSQMIDHVWRFSGNVNPTLISGRLASGCSLLVLQTWTGLCWCILNKRDLSEVSAAENPARIRQTPWSAPRRAARRAKVGCHHRLSPPASVPISPCPPVTFSCLIGDVCAHLLLMCLQSVNAFHACYSADVVIPSALNSVSFHRYKRCFKQHAELNWLVSFERKKKIHF